MQLKERRAQRHGLVPDHSKQFSPSRMLTLLQDIPTRARKLEWVVATRYNGHPRQPESATRTPWHSPVMVYLLFVSGFGRLYTPDVANLARLLRKPWLRLSSAPEWRSWIAALCVALAAFATLEQVSPAHASDICTNVAMSVTAGEPVAAAESVQDDQGPASDQQQQQRHHCCGAHNSSAPPLAHAGVPVRLAESLTPSHRSDAELDHTPSGLERPPKLTAIA